MTLFSVITPSAGKRPLALGQAIDSVYTAAATAGLADTDIEMLVGFDGVNGEKCRSYPNLSFTTFPHEGNFGNSIRKWLVNHAKGKRVLFVDDDNALTPEAFTIYMRYSEEFVIASIDVSRAFAIDTLPDHNDNRELVRAGNIDPLCICLTHDLAVRCGGWKVYSGYESDYRNILYYYKRARSVAMTREIVGIYDAGRDLDPQGKNLRQQGLLKNM